MTENRRKVLYRLSEEAYGYEPDKTQDEIQKDFELSQEQEGWFHTWTQVSESDPTSENILIAVHGVIETKNGNLIDIPYKWFRFIDDGK